MMKIVIYKENKSEEGNYDYLIKFPSETSVISIEETIQLLFVMNKDISDTRKILDLCRPWNYVRRVVYEGGLRSYSEYYWKITEYQYIDDYKCCYYDVDFIITPLYFEEPGLKGNKEIELIKNSIPHGILPWTAFRKYDVFIGACFRKKGWLDVLIEGDRVRIRYSRIKLINKKGYYHYIYNNIQEALPEINKIIGKMGCV